MTEEKINVKKKVDTTKILIFVIAIMAIYIIHKEGIVSFENRSGEMCIVYDSIVSDKIKLED